MKDIFEKDINIRKNNLEKLNKISNILGIFKIALLLALVYGIYLLFKQGVSIDLFVLLSGEIIIFVIAQIYHRGVFEKINLENGIIKINQNNLDRINGNWSKFSDIGEEFIDYNHNYGVDLDIVGKKSIFQMLNSTHTYHGRHFFADDLLNADYDKKEILLRQGAIIELAGKYDFSSYIEYLLSKIGVDNSFKNLVDELSDKKEFIANKFFKFIAKYSWLAMITIIIITTISRNVISLYILTGLLIIQTIISLIFFTKAARYFEVIGVLPKKIFKYDDIINKILSENFSSEKISEIKKELENAKSGLKSLYSIADSINRYQYGVAHFLANIFFLKDLRNAINLSEWKLKFGDKVQKWFECLGNFESLLSFANLPRVCDNIIIPEILDSKNCFEATNLGHPLILNENRISNDFSSHNNIFIISGSNMSGKTTFMRTVGINLILAKAGSYVCARKMCFSKMNIVTSMRIVDDLNEGISTFYAELKRIKMIIDKSHEEFNTLFLIDEIFRGTNSVDRLKGAEEVLRELCSTNVSGLITTHDLQVCDLEKEFGNIINMSFSESFNGDEMYFDYKLKRGKSKTTNAEYLLRKVGIIK